MFNLGSWKDSQSPVKHLHHEMHGCLSLTLLRFTLSIHDAIIFILLSECGGKNFHFVHPSANLESVINGSLRSAFEYSGQKCSALSRMYVPESAWSTVKDGLLAGHKQLKLGSPLEADTFLSAVIDGAVGALDWLSVLLSVSWHDFLTMVPIVL